MMIPSGRCFAADPMEESAAQLAIALNISTNTQVPLTNTPRLFSAGQAVMAGGVQLRQKKIRESKPDLHMDIEVANTNGNIIATGQIIECASFDTARKALLRKLVMNSMMIETLARKYEVLRGGPGDLCVAEKVYDRASDTLVVDQAVIHFVRGGTAISLRRTDKSGTAAEIARSIDESLTKAK